MDYAQAMLIIAGVGRILSGKGEMPNIYDMYPWLFEKTEEQIVEEQDKKSIAAFMNFANNFNSRLNKEDK